MNERIKELMIQCEKKYCQDHDDYFYDMEKFAELIVRECIASIPSDGHRGDFGRAVEFCQQQIKQHFGVEEPEQSASDRILSTIRKRG